MIVPQKYDYFVEYRNGLCKYSENKPESYLPLRNNSNFPFLSCETKRRIFLKNKIDVDRRIETMTVSTGDVEFFAVDTVGSYNGYT